jgi:hypothetical protein
MESDQNVLNFSNQYHQNHNNILECYLSNAVFKVFKVITIWNKRIKIHIID